MIQDEQQFQQLILLYKQLRNGSEDITRMIDNEELDQAITMIKNREEIFLNCKCIRNYLELTPVQKKEADTLLDEIRELELSNMKKLEEGMKIVQDELKKTQQLKKIQNTYLNDSDTIGNTINVQE